MVLLERLLEGDQMVKSKDFLRGLVVDNRAFNSG